MSEPDNVYYNVRMNVNTDPNQRAIFNETRVEPILKNPSHYEMAVERFKIPAVAIPIMLWKPDYYIVSFTYAGDEYEVPLIFIPNSGSPLADRYGDTVWSYQAFIDMLNIALETAFTDLKAAHAGAPPTEAPFMTYDADTQLCSFNCEQLYASNTTTINIRFNAALFGLFPSFQSYGTTEPGDIYWNRLIIADYHNNTATVGGKAYFVNVQEYSTLALWNDISSIVFLTNAIPVSAELQSGQQNISRRIITDFELSDEINNKTSIQYYPQGPLRFYDMISDENMRTIDVQVMWEDKTGKLYPIYLFLNQVLTIKLLFRRKL